MCLGRLRGSSSTFREHIHARLKPRSRLDQINVSPVMWLLVCSTIEVIMHQPSVSGPPSAQTCLYQGKADHVPAVYMEKQASVPTMKQDTLSSHSGWWELWQSEHTRRGRSVFTFTTDTAMMWESVGEYSPSWLSCRPGSQAGLLCEAIQLQLQLLMET